MYKKSTILFLIIFILFFILPTTYMPLAEVELQPIIIEVEGDPNVHREYIETYHPFIEVVAVYEKLFNGLALLGSPKNLQRMEALEFIKNIHSVQRYEAIEWRKSTNHSETMIQPFDLNTTAYTGKGVKVGVIDTGIDYDHPDLKLNYISGFDLVDLDDDPMETVPEQGIPTAHGTHVAGIIAADGEIKGVAPDAEIYAYRALGPGGAGTSVQVLAAMERAMEDEVDVINLSLGNNVNIPDYPTSVAVNRASELGIPVVIANGNSGPDDWTVGSPATADKALSVGAATSPRIIPYLYESFENKVVQLYEMDGSPSWEISRSNEVVEVSEQNQSVKGKIALLQRGEIPFYELAQSAEKNGAIAAVIYNNEPGIFQGSLQNEQNPINIPVASISMEDGKWLKNHSEKKSLYMESAYWNQEVTIATFSSRGPVTMNWNIKPDVLAPGTGIWSTVPGGHEQMDGTSMAAPHVTGAVALIKEAHPDWTREQIIGALKTTAERLQEQDTSEPTIQGMGAIRPDKAIETTTIIHDPQLNFGKVDSYREELSLEITVENVSEDPQHYTFEYSKKKNGMYWNIPRAFTLEPNEIKTLPIELSVTTSRLEEGVHQGWLTLTKENEEDYYLPYIVVNKNADQPKTAGFEFSLKNFSEDAYEFRLYLTEPARRVEVDLYNPETLFHNRKLLAVQDLQEGLLQKEISKKEAGPGGFYLAIVTVYLEDGRYESSQSMIYME
ncbi:S8 family serine peptidase [Oceanobacillus saliphilus]|uniref:S8 family serine peptidase n=1 Tax=Oceanobacillus saliphilus TaxID=2925834 RepID=UPI0027D2311A|nr:S8 family serine peptidase [Oceanobacillus saliphilus]